MSADNLCLHLSVFYRRLRLVFRGHVCHQSSTKANKRKTWTISSVIEHVHVSRLCLAITSPSLLLSVSGYPLVHLICMALLAYLVGIMCYTTSATFSWAFSVLTGTVIGVTYLGDGAFYMQLGHGIAYLPQFVLPLLSLLQGRCFPGTPLAIAPGPAAASDALGINTQLLAWLLGGVVSAVGAWRALWRLVVTQLLHCWCSEFMGFNVVLGY